MLKYSECNNQEGQKRLFMPLAFLCFLLLTNNFINAQTYYDYIEGAVYVCPGDIVTYSIPEQQDPCTYSQIHWYIENGEYVPNGHQVEVSWPLDFVEGEVRASVLAPSVPPGEVCRTGVYPLQVYAKTLNSIELIVEPYLQGYPANELIEITTQFYGDYVFNFPKSATSWSIWDEKADTLLFNLGQSASISFIPDDYRSELAQFYNSENQIVIKVQYLSCEAIVQSFKSLSLTKAPPGYTVNTKPQHCYGQNNGEITISNIDYELIPNVEKFIVKIGTWYWDTFEGKPIKSVSYFKDTTFTENSITFNDIPPSPTEINNQADSFVVSLGIIVNNLDFGLDSQQIVYVDTAQRINISIEATIPTCNGGTGEITASASGGTIGYTYAISSTDGSFTGQNPYICSPGTYTITALDTNLCSVDTIITISNPNSITITGQTDNQPLTCNPEVGKISVSASNVNSYAEFTISRSGMTPIIFTDNDEADGGWSHSFDGLEPGNYSIKVKHACELDSSIVNDLIINSLDKPSVSYTDVLVDSASCYRGEGTITISKFSHGTSDYYSNSSGLDNFSFFFNENSISSDEFFNHIGTGGDTDTLKIIDNLECTGSVIQYIGHPQQITLTAIDSVPSCRDYNNGSITLSSTQGSTVPFADRVFALRNNNEILETKTDNTAPYQAEFSAYGAEGYWVTVSDGCVVNGSTEVAVSIANYPTIEVNIDTFSISCNNANDGKIRVTPIAGDENFTLSFTGITTFTGRTINQTDSVINLESRNYEVLVSDGNGCTNTYNGITITNPPPLQIISNDSNITNVTCWDGNNGQILANATGGTGNIYFTLYDDGDNLLDSTSYAPDYSNLFDTLSAGTKTLKVTDINECFVEKDFEIKQPPEYKVTSLTTDGTKCYGGSDGSLSVTAEGGTPDGLDYTYNLMDVNNDIVDNVSGPTATFTGHSFGNYYVNIYDSSSCLLTSSSIVLNEPLEMQISVPMTALTCFSTEDITINANVTGGTAPYSFRWKDVNDIDIGTDSTIIVDAGDYTLEVIDAKNCGYGKTSPATDPLPFHFTVEKPDTLKLFIDKLQNVDYHGLSNGSVTLSSIGGRSYHQYSMDAGEYQNVPEFNDLEIGTHTFYVKDSSNCENNVTATIIQPDPFIVYLDTIKDVNCFKGSDGQIIIHAEGGWAPYNFTLDDGNGYTITQNDSVFVDLPIGAYSVNVGYNAYSQLVNNIVVNQPASALSSVITAYQSPKCTFSDGWATVTASGGTSPYSYSWSNLQTSSTATALRSGNYYVVTSDFNNCLDTSSIMLYDIAGPELSIIQINGLPCYDSDNVGSITLDVSGGTVPYTIQWNDPNQQTGLTATGLATGSYSATVTDFDGCISKSADILISRPTELIINFDGFKDPSCYNNSDGEITASATGGTPPYQFEWPEINNAGNTGIVSGLSSGVYQLNLSDDHSCVTTGSFELKNPDPIIINLNDSIFICAGQTATLDAGNTGSFYQWTSDNGFSSENQIVNLQEQGDYTITISNVQGCSNTKKVHLKFENRQFDAGFLLASQATMADTIVLIEISWPVPDSLEWQITDDFLRLVDGDAYKELIPLETGEYTIGMKAYLAGCEDIVEKTITILPSEGQKDLKDVKTDLIQSAKLFPNPNTGNFEVEVKLSGESDIRADLFSAKGLRIIPTKYDSGKKDYLINFNLMRLEPGVYFVNVAARNEVRKLKFVVN